MKTTLKMGDEKDLTQSKVKTAVLTSITDKTT